MWYALYPNCSRATTSEEVPVRPSPAPITLIGWGSAVCRAKSRLESCASIMYQQALLWYGRLYTSCPRVEESCAFASEAQSSLLVSRSLQNQAVRSYGTYYVVLYIYVHVRKQYPKRFHPEKMINRHMVTGPCMLTSEMQAAAGIAIRCSLPPGRRARCSCLSLLGSPVAPGAALPGFAPATWIREHCHMCHLLARHPSSSARHCAAPA